MKIFLKLNSPLCSGSGEGSANVVDTDIVFNDHGFPIIPARRMKGCLREAAQEIIDVSGLSEHIGIAETLFGTSGTEGALMQLSNGKLKGSGSMINEIKNISNDTKLMFLLNPQNILQEFTGIRTTTAIDSKTGSALTNSLRTTRFVEEGNVFEFDLQAV